jgi:hypothetical protein
MKISLYIPGSESLPLSDTCSTINHVLISLMVVSSRTRIFQRCPKTLYIITKGPNDRLYGLRGPYERERGKGDIPVFVMMVRYHHKDDTDSLRIWIVPGRTRVDIGKATAPAIRLGSLSREA